MSTLTIRGCDDTLSRTLHSESERRGISINKLVLDVLLETFLEKKKRNREDDLSHLAGTWSGKEAAAFDAAVADFETVDLKDWK